MVNISYLVHIPWWIHPLLLGVVTPGGQQARATVRLSAFFSCKKKINCLFPFLFLPSSDFLTFSLLLLACYHSQVFRKALIHEFHISYIDTEWHLFFSHYGRAFLTLDSLTISIMSFQEKRRYHSAWLYEMGNSRVHEWFPKHSRMGTARIKKVKETDEGKMSSSHNMQISLFLPKCQDY